MSVHAKTLRCNLVLTPVTCGAIVLGWEWVPLDGTSDSWRNKVNRESFAESLHAIAWALLHGLTVSQDLTPVDGARR